MTNEPSQTADRTEPTDWPAYYRHTLGREPRPLFVRGLAAAAATGLRPGRAIDVGFGDGTETLSLLDAGWQVLAIDPTEAAAAGLRSRVSPMAANRLEIRTVPADVESLPPFDLLYAGFALSFIAPGAFPAFWSGVRRQLRPGGLLVVNVFGDRDSWVVDPAMTFADRATVDALFDGLEVIEIVEEDADGEAFSGPKHWHVFHVIARRPIPAAGAGVPST